MGVSLQTGSRHSGRYTDLDANQRAGTETHRASQEPQESRSVESRGFRGFFKKVGDVGKMVGDLLLKDSIEHGNVDRKDSFGDRPYSEKVIRYNVAMVHGQKGQSHLDDKKHLLPYLDRVIAGMA